MYESLPAVVGAWQRGSRPEAEARLRTMLHQCGLAPSSFDRYPWPRLVGAASDLHADWPGAELSAIQAVGECTHESGDLAELLVVHQLLVVLGMYRSANVVRELAASAAIDALHSAGPATPAVVVRGFGAALETGDMKSVKAAVRKSAELASDPLSKPPFPGSEVVGHFETGSAFQFLERRAFLPGDAAFRELIEGKSVAIVGPAPGRPENAAEIAGFDVVVKFNTRSHGDQPGAPTGGRVDVSYYNGEQATFIAKSDSVRIPRDLKFAVLKGSKYRWLADRAGVPGRALYPFPWRFNGTFNAIPNAVFDLLLFDPRRIKIFNATFFLSIDLSADGRTHVEDYRPAGLGRIDSGLTAKCFPVQDPVMQFSLLKQLYLSGRIEADETLRDIFSFSGGEYMARLQQCHGFSAVIHPANQPITAKQ